MEQDFVQDTSNAFGVIRMIRDSLNEKKEFCIPPNSYAHDSIRWIASLIETPSGREKLLEYFKHQVRTDKI